MIQLNESVVNQWVQSDTLLQYGEEGLEVEVFQSMLVKMGFDPGPLDGDFGPRTQRATERFQEARIIMPDCVVGKQTRKEIYTCWKTNWDKGKVPFKHRSGVMVWGPHHPGLGGIPATFGKMSTFGGMLDPGDLMYDQSLISAKDPSGVKKRYPHMVEAGVFRDIDELPKQWVHPKNGNTYKPGISWMLNRMSFYIAMRWPKYQRMVMTKDPMMYQVLVGVPDKDLWCAVVPTDYGPAKKTFRNCDLSPGTADALALAEGAKDVMEDGAKLKTDSWVVHGWISSPVILGPITWE